MNTFAWVPAVLGVVTLAGFQCPFSSNTPELNTDLPIQEAVTQPAQGDNDQMVVSDQRFTIESGEFSLVVPRGMEMTEQRLQIEHPDGRLWRWVTFENNDIPEHPYLRVDENPNGYGPFFPHQRWVIQETASGALTVVEKQNTATENSPTNNTLIFTNVLNASNGNTYQMHFRWENGGDNMEAMFEQILESGQIL